MRTRLLATATALLLAFGAAGSVFAQARSAAQERVELPVWNRASGEIEAVLVLESTNVAQNKVRARFGVRHLDDTFGLSAGDSLGVVCDRKPGQGRALSQLGQNCVLAALSDRNRRSGASALFHRNNNRVGVGVGQSRSALPAFLSPRVGNGRIDVNDLTIFAQRDLPREGFVSIAGTVAKARLLSPADTAVSDRWTSRQLNLGGGLGAFGVNIVGEVVDTGGPDKWEAFGLGLSWRTPWSGQLTVGADNVVTRGKNPFAPSANQDDEGAVPYVRYEQDL